MGRLKKLSNQQAPKKFLADNWTSLFLSSFRSVSQKWPLTFFPSKCRSRSLSLTPPPLLASSLDQSILSVSDGSSDDIVLERNSQSFSDTSSRSINSCCHNAISFYQYPSEADKRVYFLLHYRKASSACLNIMCSTMWGSNTTVLSPMLQKVTLATI